VRKKIYISVLDNDVIVSKRKGIKNLRLTIKSNGEIRVSAPYGLRQSRIDQFIKEKTPWIQEHHKVSSLIRNGSRIGKHHTVVVHYDTPDKPSSRITKQLINISLPIEISEDSKVAQKTIIAAAQRALLQEAKNLIPQRVEFLATKAGIPFKSIKIKRLTSRWGSCDNNSNLVFNSYLMQLDWDLIDYVVVHELAHTKFHNHQSKFWLLVEALMPTYKARRKLLKEKPTHVIPTLL